MKVTINISKAELEEADLSADSLEEHVFDRLQLNADPRGDFLPNFNIDIQVAE